MDSRSPISFAFIRDATREGHGFDIDPLWVWLLSKGAISSDLTRESDIVWSSPGIFSYKPPVFDEEGRQLIAREAGVWRAVWHCYRAAAPRPEQARFLSDFAEVLSKARNALVAVTRALDKGSEAYLVQLGSFLDGLGSTSGAERRRVLNAVDLPGPFAFEDLAFAFGRIDNRLANLHTNVARRVSSPIPIEPPTRRGPPERQLLREVEMILRKIGFPDAEICSLVMDGGSSIDAVDRVRERRRVRARNRRKLRV